MDIPHRKKEGPSKLVTELRLYRLLYENWNGRAEYQDMTGGAEDDDPGVPLADLRRLADLSPRTWNRYLRELEACRAIRSARFHRGGRYCLAEKGDLKLPAVDLDDPANAHLRRLYRTVYLMNRWLEKKQRGPEELGESYSVKVFYGSLRDADEWFFEPMNQRISVRSMQRDLKDVWTALKDEETERTRDDGTEQ
jgi:hypothetical protein